MRCVFSINLMKEIVSRSICVTMLIISRCSHHRDHSFSGALSCRGGQTPFVNPCFTKGRKQQFPVKPGAGALFNANRYLMVFEQ
jgi:hypothetical protein